MKILTRMLFYVLQKDVSEYMQLLHQGSRNSLHSVYSVDEIQLDLSLVQQKFNTILIKPISQEISSEAIQLLYHSSYQYLICPNSATSFALGVYYLHYQLALERKETECSFHDFVLPAFESAFVDVMNSHLVHQCCLFCLNTAHPGKFPYFVAEALDAPAGNIMPKDIQE